MSQTVGKAQRTSLKSVVEGLVLCQRQCGVQLREHEVLAAQLRLRPGQGRVPQDGRRMDVPHGVHAHRR